MGINTNRWNRLRYTLYAPVYDRVVRFQRPRSRSVDLLELRQGERVLIDGAGTGADLDFIPNGVEVVATDLTPPWWSGFALALLDLDAKSMRE